MNVRKIHSFDQINLNNITFKESINFLYGQSESILVLGYMIEYKNEFVNHDYKYILHKFYMLFGDWNGQSQEMIDKYNSLSDELAYFLNKDLYLKGGGIGSSFFGDFYDLGYIGFVIACLTTGSILYFFEKYYFYSRTLQILSFYVVGQTVWMARAETLYYLKNIFYLMIIFIITNIFFFIIKNTLFDFNNERK